MRVIFLDIDGVLVNRESLMKASGMRAKGAASCVAELNRVTDATGARIVVSSTWRYYHRQMGFETPTEFMRETLKAWGVTGEVIGCTPDLSRRTGTLYAGAERGDEIQAWLDSEAYERRPLKSFVILDDDRDMKHLGDRLVRTNTETGLTKEQADFAISYLLTPASPRHALESATT